MVSIRILKDNNYIRMIMDIDLLYHMYCVCCCRKNNSVTRLFLDLIVSIGKKNNKSYYCKLFLGNRYPFITFIKGVEHLGLGTIK